MRARIPLVLAAGIGLLLTSGSALLTLDQAVKECQRQAPHAPLADIATCATRAQRERPSSSRRLVALVPIALGVVGLAVVATAFRA